MYYQAIFKLEPCEKNGTHLQVYVPGVKVNEKYFENQLVKGEIRIDDGRLITAAQRGLLFALFADIEKQLSADGSKSSIEEIKEDLKAKFCLENNQDYFSLSNVNISIASDFIDYVLEFTFINGVRLKFKTFEAAKEWRTWSYICFKHRECTICRSKGAEVHHIKAIGQGMNRNKVDHSKIPLIMLCRQHHQEAHNVGWITFSNKYYVAGIFVSVATLKALNIKGEYGEEANVEVIEGVEVDSSI